MLTYDLGNVFGGLGYTYARPFHWQKRQWKHFGGTLVGSGLLYLVDDDVSRFISNQRESIPQRVRDYGTFYGGPTNNLIFSGAVLTTGLVFKNPKIRRAGVLMFSSGLTAGIFQQSLKYLIGRARPIADKGKYTFKPLTNERDYHSFFSGHTALAFTTAYAFGKQFKNPWTRGLIYGIGLVPGISRVWDKQHWISDFAVGVVISIATVEAIDRYLDKKYKEKYNAGDKKMSWNLNMGINTVGVTLQF
jgi:membrane-associated phospholipid phosphatase